MDLHIERSIDSCKRWEHCKARTLANRRRLLSDLEAVRGQPADEETLKKKAFTEAWLAKFSEVEVGLNKELRAAYKLLSMRSKLALPLTPSHKSQRL